MTVSLAHPDKFVTRHIGPSAAEQAKMLTLLDLSTLDALINETVPESIRLHRPLNIPEAKSEYELLALATTLGQKNRVCRSYLGLGYHDTITPPVILRNIVQNPGWYTQYTPYQAEIAQGRLEALLNFQTMVCDLTGLEVANASLLDEATAAAEAMAMAYAFKGTATKTAFLVDVGCHLQTIEVLQTRAEALGLHVHVGPINELIHGPLAEQAFGVLVQYPTTLGHVADYRSVAARVHGVDALFVVAADILALTVLRPPGEFGADVAVGCTQRFGVPLGYGGPHCIFCDQTRVRTQVARTHYRIIGGRAGSPRNSYGAANPRATYSP
jgi:glycine dehydrogenase